MACFIDDVLWGGNTEFENIVNKLKQIFYISSEHKQVFNYIGIKLEQRSDFSIVITQKDYINTINPVELNKDDLKNPKCKLPQEEITILRGIPGKLNWVAGMARPEISFFVCKTSTRVKDATVSDLIATNKVVKFIQSTPTYIRIPIFDIESFNIKLYSDASFNNLPNGGSQGGFIILLSDKYNNVAPIAWSSIKLKRVGRSTIAADTLALLDGCDTSFSSITRNNIVTSILKPLRTIVHYMRHFTQQNLYLTNAFE